jgi:hypothetical protein
MISNGPKARSWSFKIKNPPRYREVVEQTVVTATIIAEASIYPRLDEAFNALTWRLARDAESGYLLDEKHWVYKQQGSKKHKVPGLIALYIIDNFQVTILSIEVCVY